MLLLCGCSSQKQQTVIQGLSSAPSQNLGGDDTSFGENLTDTGAYDGYFTDDAADIIVECISGTDNCCTLNNSTLTFSGITEESIYKISGKLRGNIIIDVGDSYKLELEMHGFSLVCDKTNPITVNSADKVTLKAKSGFDNYIYDTRAAIDETDEALHKGAIHSEADLEISGKGSLTVISENNNGIHTKDDLKVKNLSLFVSCNDNALKGNDSVSLTNCTTTLIAAKGDGIKTTNSDISSKGNQRGIITIAGGIHNIYAAGDGIDASYDVQIDEESTQINIYTDKYSNYSEEVVDTADTTENTEASASAGISSSSISRTASQQQITARRPERPGGDFGGGGFGGGRPDFGGGFGGMQDGNTDKGTYSTKGIKAANSINIVTGSIAVKSYDDAIHANNEATLENGASPTGDVLISGGNLSLYTNDDGIHADGTLTISGGTTDIQHSYEGLEANTVKISNGNISVKANDDGINGTTTEGTAISISGGTLYIYCSGDGIDSNSRTSYQGIVFSGGNSVIISNSRGNSAIDTERGYSYLGGTVLAIMPTGGMTSEATHCENFSSIATTASLNGTAGETVTVKVDGSTVTTASLPAQISGQFVFLGSSNAEITLSAA